MMDFLMSLGVDYMKALLTQIAQSLVDNPEQVEVNEIVSTQTVVLELRVAKSDLGKVIGKQGRTAHAIRTLLNAASGGTGKRYVLEIVE
jgi:uncharacterized protein